MSEITPEWLKLGYFVDAKDTMSQWCVAEVIKLEESTVTVNMDGWGARWNTPYPVQSSKLAPFRRHSRGYTGPKRNTLRDWKYSSEEMAEMSAKAHELLEKGLLSQSAFETSQFFRGRLFIFVENLLIHNYDGNKEQLSQTVEFFVLAMRLIIAWLKQAPKLFSHYYRGLEAPALYLEDTHVALASAWPELLDILKKLFALDQRVNDFFKHNDEVPEWYEPCDLTHMQLDRFSSTLSFLINLFAKEGGFQAVLDIIKNEDEQGRVPFAFITPILFYTLNDFLDSNFSAEYFKEFTQAIFHRIEMISESELKIIDYEEIVFMLVRMSNLSRSIDGSVLTLNKLLLFQKMLTSGYLEKRIKGLNEINNIIDEIEDPKLTQDELTEWLNSNQIPQVIFTDRPHRELVKRAGTILKFLAKAEALDQQILGLLWDSAEEKHEAYVRGMLSTVIEISPWLSESQNEYILTKFSQISEYDAYQLQVLKDFTISTAESATSGVPHEAGIKILYNCLREGNVELSKLCVKYLAEVLNSDYCCDQKDEFIVSAIKNLNSPLVMKVLRLVLDSGDKESIETRLRALDEEYHLKDIVIDNTVAYLQNPVASPLGVRYNLKVRLTFLRFLSSKSSNSILIKHQDFTRIWDLTICKDLHPELYYDWLHAPGGAYRTPITLQEGTELYYSHFLSPEKFVPSKIGKKAFNCFKWLFINFNHQSKCIEMSQSKFKLRKKQEVAGVNQLLNIQLEAPVEEVSVEATKLLVGLFTKYDVSLVDKAPEILRSMTTKLFEHVLENTQNQELVTRALVLVKALIDLSEDSSNKTSTVYVNDEGSKDLKQISVDLNKNIRHLRMEIAKEYGMELEQTVLVINERRYGAPDDDIELKPMKVCFVMPEFGDIEYCEFNPSQALSEDEVIFSSLFDLLSYPDMKYTDLAWNLLVSMPTSQTLMNDFKKLEKPLNHLIDENSMYRLLYELNIIQQLAETPKWVTKFTQAGGVSFLEAIYTKPKTAEASPFNSKYEAKMVCTLGKLITVETRLASPDDLSVSLLKSVYISSLCIQEKESIGLFEEAKKLYMVINQIQQDSITSLLFTQQQLLKDIFQTTLISCEDSGFARRTRKLLEKLAKSTDSEQALLELLISSMEDAISSRVHSKNYWALSSSLIAYCEPSDTLSQLVTSLLGLIEASEGEKSSTDKNVVIGGAFQVLTKAWTKMQINPDSRHLDLILHKCLFEVPRQGLQYPICKHPATRKSAFNMLLTLARGHPGFLELLIQYLSKFHQEPKWRSSSKADWHYSPGANEKSDTGFVGLKNLGCICYMNSLLQQLFMMGTWREAVMQAPAEEPYSENILYQMQSLITGLKHSDKQYVNPRGFTSAFKDFEGNPINVLEQMDAEEFLGTFFDRMEELLRGTASDGLIKRHFGGLQAIEMIGKDCVHRSERHEPFLTIQVEVKNKRSILQGLESFVEGELLEGENAYQCANCDAKVKALRRVSIKHLPNFLIIALQRFEFDFDTMSRHKLNDYCEFPLELNMEPYTQEGLERAELIKDGREAPAKFPQDYYTYNLRGTVIHIGTAENGHYYSFIHHAEGGQWLEFDDKIVRRIDQSCIPRECFGADDRGGKKYGNAYLLFYERKGVYSNRDPESDELTPLDLTVREFDHSIEEMHLKTVKEQNQRYWRTRSIFGEEYSEFVRGISEISNPPNIFIMEFFLTILIRSKDRFAELIPLYRHIESTLSDPQYSLWFLDVITSENVLEELLFYCPVYMMRKVVVGLAKTALSSIDEASAENILKRLLVHIDLATRRQSRYYAQYLDLLVSLVRQFRPLVSKYDLVERFIAYMMREKIEFAEEEMPEYTSRYLGYEEYTPREEDMRDSALYAESKGSTCQPVISLLTDYMPEMSEDQRHSFLKIENIFHLLKDFEPKKAAWSVGLFYAHICSESPANTANFSKILVHMHKHIEHYHKAKFQKIITAFLSFEDSLYDSKIVDFTDMFISTLMTAGPAEKEVSLNYLFRATTKFNKMRTHVYENKQEELDLIKKWINQNVKNSSPKHNETAENQKFKLMLIKISILAIGEPPCSDEWDSDEEIIQKDIQDECDVLDYTGQTWRKAVVDARIGDVLLVKYYHVNSTMTALRDAVSDEVSLPSKRTRTY